MGQRMVEPARREGNGTSARRVEVREGRGLSLPRDLRTQMQESLQTDFSRLRLAESPSLPDINARALAQGDRLLFAPGAFSTGSGAGRRLIGHELSHLAAQARGEVPGGGLVYNPALEGRADREGALAARGLPAVAPDVPVAALKSRSGAPVQGYFTVNPGDYVLDSDGNKAAFATHHFENMATTAAQTAEKTAFTQEFSAPPAALEVVRQAVEAVDGDAARWTALAANLAPDALLAQHRKIVEATAAEHGSDNPAFRQTLDYDEATNQETFAAMGIHRYTGKVVLHVSDDHSLAINAQTSEPKEYYSTPAQLAQSNARLTALGGKVRLTSFPGNQVTIAGHAPLSMVRPAFNVAMDGMPAVMSHERSITTVCSDFSKHVTAGHEPRNLSKEQSNRLLAPTLDLPAARRRLANDMTGWEKVKYAFGGREADAGILQEVADRKHPRPNAMPSAPEGTPPLYSGALSREGYGALAIPEIDEAAREITGEEPNRRTAGLTDPQLQAEAQRTRAMEDRLAQTEQYEGLNRRAVPQRVGDRYEIITLLGKGWEYHWGAVVALTNSDSVTLENYNRSTDINDMVLRSHANYQRLKQARDAARALLPAAAQPARAVADQAALDAFIAAERLKRDDYGAELLKTWFFNMQGVNQPGKTFHEQQDVTGAFGVRSMTRIDEAVR